MNLRDNISERRRAMGLTQEDVASKLGVSRQTVGKWEAGKAVPELEKLIALCDLLKCTLDELVGRTDMKDRCACAGGDLSGAGNAESEAPIETDPSADSKDEAETLRGKRSAMRAGILATGVCLLFAAVGPLFFLIGPWPVENVEVRCAALLAAALGACLGVVLIVASTKVDPGDIEARVAGLAASRKWRVAALALSLVVVALASMLFFLAPSTRTTTLVFIELVALASWPITIVIALSKDNGK